MLLPNKASEILLLKLLTQSSPVLVGGFA
ncbi:MAG: hypothetical protein H6Q41_4822, partial [Deltaproteobacteria bacterium]|nr:hypothetical protein [Deltaproteobacteria bacterium]